MHEIDDNGHTIHPQMAGLSDQMFNFITNTGPLFKDNATVTFIIGGSDGLSEKVINKCNQKISFSRLTFPHQLMRIVLLEQIYRTTTIWSGKTYHK